MQYDAGGGGGGGGGVTIHCNGKLGYWVGDFLQSTWQQEILCQLQLANKKGREKSWTWTRCLGLTANWWLSLTPYDVNDTI